MASKANTVPQLYADSSTPLEVAQHSRRPVAVGGSGMPHTSMCLTFYSCVSACVCPPDRKPHAGARVTAWKDGYRWTHGHNEGLA